MLIDGLQHADAFPHDVQHIEMLETHISWIILTGEVAYKIKKPLDLGFLNFSTLDLRRYYCNEEVRLNRRFAPGLYRDVVPIGGTPEHPKIGTEPAIEWAVRMHQFPADAGLDHQVAARSVSVADMRRLGETVAAAHGAADVATDNGYGSLNSIRSPARDNFISLAADCAKTDLLDAIATLRQWTEHETARLEPVFVSRLMAGHIRECHGDLHVGNIVRLSDEYVPFDCLEFDPALRWIDVISDVAFLVMDLLHLERADLAFVFLNRYLEVTGDYTGLAVLPYYIVYRAAVRAKITAVRRRQENPDTDPASVTAYLQLASRIATPKRKALLIVCHGVSGSGKTWLSEKLIPVLAAIRLRSDIVRKKLHGLTELARSDADVNEGLYARDATRRTYAQIAEFAKLALDERLNVIIDATCLQRADRHAFRDIAATAGASFVIVHCDARRPVLEERICRRECGGTDASEANLAVLKYQLARQEPLDRYELAYSVRVDTSGSTELNTIINAIRSRTDPDTSTR